MDEELQRSLRENMEHKHYIFTLSNRLSSAEFECGQIRESASKAAEYSDDVLMQRDLRYENSLLKGQLERMTSQRQIIAKAETNSLGPSDRAIWQELELIATDIKDACSSVEITIPTAAVNTHNTRQEAKEADSWTRRVARRFHIVRALAAAGVSDLVFESKFPDFLARESPILDQYRNHILVKAGPQTLYQLDILACRSVMSEGYFKSHILPTTAKALSETFCNALAHIISPNDQTMVGAEPDGLFPAGVHASQTENPVATVFSETFVRALKLKQDLMLSRNKYKLVFFRPGDVFDSDTMIRDGDGYSAFTPARALGKKSKDWPRQRQAEGNSNIKLCLFPALYSRPEEGLTGDYGIGVSVRNCLVDCDNFITDDDGSGEGELSLVVKGVVLV
ncbi:hypothetical protein MMYC01_209542 [Madurella mycetomatis]|uniref:Uncharacterized protein n=1 Tax=Madurella mycetomatis TaxID=100816 RepID=A0A175VSZ4_9PEZI|nr:hypothetical protein MMYC01_209542 [Madurella mycetomatis]